MTNKFVRKALCLTFIAGVLSCQSRALGPQQNPTVTLKTQTANENFTGQFVQTAQLNSKLLKTYQERAQAYSDSISQRRDLDLFQLHTEVLGLKLSFQNANGAKEEGALISFLGTAKTRADLNVELRVLAGKQLGMNLNYSGPVTRGLVSNTAGNAQTTQTSESAAATQNAPLSFELITGLPSERVTQAYGDYLNSLANYLRYRFQSKPVTFDDGPLIYAIHNSSKELLGFAFFNTRNLLTLGDRKYADVQSVAVFDQRGQSKGAYTLVAFNPKTKADQPLKYTLEKPDQLPGQLAVLGDY